MKWSYLGSMDAFFLSDINRIIPTHSQEFRHHWKPKPTHVPAVSAVHKLSVCWTQQHLVCLELNLGHNLQKMAAAKKT